MNKRVYFATALWLAIAALIAHCVARDFLNQASHRKAAAISRAVKLHTPYVTDPLAIQATHMWNVLAGTGVVLTVLPAICMVIAIIRHEPGWYLILLLLLVFNIVLPMLLWT